MEKEAEFAQEAHELIDIATSEDRAKAVILISSWLESFRDSTIENLEGPCGF